MIKKLFASLLIATTLLFGCGNKGVNKSDPSSYTTIGQGPTLIYVVNQSDFDSNRLNTIVNAVDVQLQKDLKPSWGIDAHLVLAQSAPSNSSTVTILQDFSSFPNAWHLCTGFHKSGFVGYVDKNECEDELVFSVTLSHEVLEMLSNPQGLKGGYEICDPCQSRYAGYLNQEVPSVMVSDFVYQNFYIPGSVAPYDRTNNIKAPLTPMLGGAIFNTIQGKTR